MKNIKSLFKKLKAFDLVIIVFFTFLIFVNLIFRHDVQHWVMWIFLNIGIILLTFVIAYFEAIYDNKFWRAVHYWYTAPLILLTFKELYFLIEPIRGHDYDWLFIKIDRWIFGTDPTLFLLKISFPLLTEILQIIYSSFYLLPVLLGLFLLRKKRYLAMDYAVFTVIYGFYLSYLGYFALPGIGPRFTLMNFAHLNQELPGLFFTKYLRHFLNFAESISKNTTNPAAVVQRDVFPSGHTMITLIVMYLSVKMRSRSRFFFVPVGSLLIFATVYLQYHYVIDLVGGLIFMMFTVWSGKYIFNWWSRKLGVEEFEYDKC